MTKFKREDFSYHGGYLMFHGDAGSANEYYDNNVRPCHPTRDGKRKELFVARFKYSSGDKGRFLTFLINNFTPEEYFTLLKTPDPTNAWNNPFSPATILEAKGYISATIRKGMKRKGYEDYSKAGYRNYFEKEVSSGDGDCSEYWASVDATYAAILKAAA